MDEKQKLLSTFEVFYVSKEPSQNPVSPQIMLFAKNFENNPLLKGCHAVLSHQFGNRVVITTTEDTFPTVSTDDFVELVDYDPIKQVLLILGRKKPLDTTPLHWMIHHARSEVHVVLEFRDTELVQKISQQKKPVVLSEGQKGIIEQAKALLSGFRKSNTVVVDDQTVFLVGMNLKELADTLQQFLADN